jgi:hypothetical protein
MRAVAGREAAAGRPVALAAYLGYPSDDEAAQIADRVDRVFLNYHGADPAAAYARAYVKWGTARARLHAFTGGGRQVEVWPIFYRCGEANMGPWLDSHGEPSAEATFRAALAAEPATLRADLLVPGFAYFRYGSPTDPACPG